MSNLVFDTTKQLFNQEKILITPMNRDDFEDNKEPIENSFNTQEVFKPNTSNTSNKISFITTRSKKMPKKNLCSLDNYIKENK